MIDSLPPPPSGRTGWPWTEETPPLPQIRPDGSSWPRVSVVTPSFNQAQFIEETIRSVLLQGYPNLEYIIIDGGSTDGSVEIIHKYESWLSYWVSEPDKGQSDAINKGWTRTTGSILAWLNSDDSYNPRAFQIAVQQLQAHPAAGMVYGNNYVIDANSQIISQTVTKPLSLVNIVTGESLLPQETTFIRRQTLERVGFFVDDNLHYAMDFDLWLRIAREFELLYIPEALANFRVSTESKTVSQSDKWLPEILRILERTFDAIDLGDRTDFIKSLAYGRVYWRRGVSNYANGNEELGKKYCQLALQYPDWIEADTRKFINPLVYGDLSVSEDKRKALIRKVLDDLSYATRQNAKLKRAVWHEYYASQIFKAHNQSNRAAAVRNFGAALIHSPTCLKNRGLLLVALENLLGTTTMNGLRNLAQTLQTSGFAKQLNRG